MRDLIDRQAAIDALTQRAKFLWDRFHEPCHISGMIDAIDSVPSAQPESCEYWDAESNYCALNRPSAQPEIIRCRDCSHFHEYEWYCDAWNNSPGFPKVTEDGFCDLAERGTDEN